jgi:hypothetical protein
MKYQRDENKQIFNQSSLTNGFAYDVFCNLQINVSACSPEQFLSYPAAVTKTDDRAANLDLCFAHVYGF